MTIHEPDAARDGRTDLHSTPICPVDRLTPDRGVAALVDGHPVALFLLSDGLLAAVDHIDPFTDAPVIARGLVGSHGDRSTVASPLHKQRFDLITGRCLDSEDPRHQLNVHEATIVDGWVHVRLAAPGRDTVFGSLTHHGNVRRSGSPDERRWA